MTSEKETRRAKIDINSIILPIVFLLLALASIIMARLSCEAMERNFPAVSDTQTEEIDNYEAIRIDNGEDK